MPGYGYPYPSAVAPVPPAPIFDGAARLSSELKQVTQRNPYFYAMHDLLLLTGSPHTLHRRRTSSTPAGSYTTIFVARRPMRPPLPRNSCRQHIFTDHVTWRLRRPPSDRGSCLLCQLWCGIEEPRPKFFGPPLTPPVFLSQDQRNCELRTGEAQEQARRAAMAEQIFERAAEEHRVRMAEMKGTAAAAAEAQALFERANGMLQKAEQVKNAEVAAAEKTAADARAAEDELNRCAAAEQSTANALKKLEADHGRMGPVYNAGYGHQAPLPPPPVAAPYSRYLP